MARSVRISEKAARVLDEHREKYGASTTSPLGQALEEVRHAVVRLGRAPSSGLRQAGRKAKGSKFVATWTKALRPTKAEKRERRAAIREEVFARSEEGGVPRCEGPGGQLHPKFAGQVRCGNAPTQLAHAFGRGKGRMPESERNCMALCDSCAYAETHNQPTAEFWWSFRADFFERMGFAAEARAARDRAVFVESRSRLPAAPRAGVQCPECGGPHPAASCDVEG